MKLSYPKQVLLLFSLWLACSLQSFGQQITVNFNSYTQNQGLSNPHIEGALRFEAIKGTSATCTVCIGIDINEGKNGGPGLDDSNQEVGGIIGWKISRADGAAFQFLSIWLQDRDISNILGTSDAGTIKAFKGGAQVGNAKPIVFDSGTSGLKSFAADPDFFDVESVLIEGADLFLILDEVTHNVPFVDDQNAPPAVLAINLVGSPLSSSTSVTYNVEFSKIADNVTVDDFELTKTGSANGTIASVSGSNATFEVHVTGLSGEGTIRLDLKAGTDIANENNVSGTAAFTAGQLHTISPCLVEDFEDETDAGKTFSYGGNDFSITGNLEVHTQTPSIGINGSRYVLLNTGSGPYVINSLSNDISLRKFAVFLSSDANGNNPTSDGSITVVGKKGGSQVYSITKSSGFPTDFSANNGYYIFDLRTEGGADNSKILIDQLEISLGSAFQYINIDNFEFCLDLDAIDPIINDCPTNISVSNDPGNCGAVVTWTAPTAIDNSGSVTLTSNFEPGAVFPVGTTEVIYTATDAAGNQATCSFNVTVTDSEAPAITCPANITTNVAFGEIGKVVNYDLPVATDNCGTPSILLTAGLASGAVFPSGTTTVSYEATDAAGNKTSCSFTVTITEDPDAVDPVINDCPTAITVSNDAGDCSAVVNWTAPTAIDNSGSVILRSNFEPGAVFPVGTTEVIYTATDAEGNQATCSFNVTVTDSEAPAITCPANISTNVAFGEIGKVVNYDLPVATDNCATPSIQLTAGLASGAVFPLGTTTVSYEATDATGNKASCSFTVTVTEDADAIDPVINDCPSAITLSNNTGDCSAAVNWTAPTAIDNSGSVTLTSNFEPGAVFPVGTTLVTYTATDAAGNQVTCSFDVIVLDTEIPVIGSVSDINVSVPFGQRVTSVSVSEPSVSDNCSATVTGARNDGKALTDPYPLGETRITWSAKDPTGNQAVEVVQKVIVTEIIPSLGIASFTLVDAATEGDILTLTDGLQISADQVKGFSLNIRANTNPSVVGSVYLTLSGPVNRKSTENDAPYALFGDKNGNYNGKTLPAGTYTLTAQAYSLKSRKGIAGPIRTITFTINSPVVRLDGSQSSGDKGQDSESNIAETEAESLELMTGALKAYPNPIRDGRVTVQDRQLKSGEVRYMLYSVHGALIQEGTVAIGEENTIRLDFAQKLTHAAMYILVLDNENYLVPKRVNLIFE